MALANATTASAKLGSTIGAAEGEAIEGELATEAWPSADSLIGSSSYLSLSWGLILGLPLRRGGIGYLISAQRTFLQYQNK